MSERSDDMESEDSPEDSAELEAARISAASPEAPPAVPQLESASASPPTRREIMSQKMAQSRRNRPFILAAVLILLGISVIPAWGFVNEYVLPPREKAVRVEDRIYTRGEVVDFIRFHQRLSEETGQQFDIGASLFDALQTISENEMAFQGAPSLGVTVTDAEIDREVRRLLGYGYITEDLRTAEIDGQIAEAKFQFLNNVGLKESRYREIVQKDLFRSKVRERVAEDVPRIQEQVRLYRIILEGSDQDLRNRIVQRVNAGESFSDLAFEYSVDSDVRRNGGDEGWLPAGVVPQLDTLLFGTNEDGTPVLRERQVSGIVRIPGEGTFGLLYVDERAAARELDAASLEVLKDRALTDWFEEARSRIEVELVDINSAFASWANEQVRLASVLPTAVPDNSFAGGVSVDEFGQIVPAVGP